MNASNFNKAERLVIAGAVAPVLRDGSARNKTRVVKTYSGRVVTLADVQAGLLAKTKIELEVDDGVRPKSIVCACGAVVKVRPDGGPVPKSCRICSRRKASRAAHRKWKAANPEKAREFERKYLDANREKVRKRAREAARKYRDANREKTREAARKRYAANPEKSNERSHKWRAKKKAEREASK